MAGHGGPRASPYHIPNRLGRTTQLVRRFMPAILLTLCSLGTSRADDTIRVRLSWGGGAARVWRGVIQLSEGTLSDPIALGRGADEPGSMWLHDGELRIWQRSSRDFDAVDLTLSAGLDAKLIVGLLADDEQELEDWIEIPLATLVSETFDANLDDFGTRLMVRRTPDDILRVWLPDRDSLVFDPGERLTFNVQPYLLPVKPDDRVRIKMELTRARASDVIWSDIAEVVAGEKETIQKSISLPLEEGVYDLVLTAGQKSWLRLPKPGQNPLAGIKTVARRKMQLVVIDRQRPRVWDAGVGDLNLVEEIDPANPKWWEKIYKGPKLPRLKRFWKGPLGNGNTQTWQHPLGEMVRLSSPDDGSDIGWEAYTLPIKNPGLPHVLEIDYPSDVPQTLGITIIEPNATDAVDSPGVDSGVELARQIVTVKEHPELLRHRLVFWPRTKAPIALLTNRRAGSAAVYGKIRVYDGWKQLPRAARFHEKPSGRLLAAYLDRPMFPENFSASDTKGSADNLGVDDWVTFYQGGTRLVEYLNYVGFGGAMLSVFADGGTIYPSRLLEPTPRYDTGIFLDAGQDPLRKDVLELLFRLFDREQLQLIPAMEFASPLPELEALLRFGGPESTGVRWIGKAGLPLTEVHPSRQGMAPYYNVLHPLVQEAILRAVRELVVRYAHHRSFAGLSLQLTGNGYAQLPGPQWGMDDVTIGAFEADTGIKIPATGTEKFAYRADFIAARCQAQWLDWRAARLAAFYGRVEAELKAMRPGARFYLAGAKVFDGGELERQLKPTLPERDLDEALMQVGIDVARYRLADGPILLRAERVGPRWSLGRQAENLVLRRMLDTDRSFNALPLTGSLFYHQPQEVRLDSFDSKSPHQPSYTRLATELVPSGPQNRRRFVHAVATLDSQVIFDGGLQLPMGQEDSIRELADAYRRLPAVRMRRVSDQPDSDQTQPVTIRYVNQADGTYVCVMNDAPFAATARVSVLAPGSCRLDELTGRRRVESLRADDEGMYWRVKLEPYDLIAVRLSHPGAKLANSRVFFPNDVATSIEDKIDDLAIRMVAIHNHPAMDGLKNSDFESPAAPKEKIPGWIAPAQPGAVIQLDSTRPHGGTRSVRLTSQGRGASLVSQPFDAPTTGRLTVAVWLRVAPGKQQSQLRLAVEGTQDGDSFFRSVPAGVPREGAGWHPVAFRIRDLPLDKLSQLRLRFDLMGPGDVWIDDVVLRDLDFDERPERPALLKIVSPADNMFKVGHYGDCIRLLESYWPRFLVANVPAAAATVTRKNLVPTPPAATPPKENEESPGLFGRLKGLVPEKLRY
jgi:glycosyl hydrolase family 10